MGPVGMTTHTLTTMCMRGIMALAALCSMRTSTRTSRWPRRLVEGQGMQGLLLEAALTAVQLQ